MITADKGARPAAHGHSPDTLHARASSRNGQSQSVSGIEHAGDIELEGTLKGSAASPILSQYASVGERVDEENDMPRQTGPTRRNQDHYDDRVGDTCRTLTLSEPHGFKRGASAAGEVSGPRTTAFRE